MNKIVFLIASSVLWANVSMADFFLKDLKMNDDGTTTAVMAYYRCQGYPVDIFEVVQGDTEQVGFSSTVNTLSIQISPDAPIVGDCFGPSTQKSFEINLGKVAPGTVIQHRTLIEN